MCTAISGFLLWEQLQTMTVGSIAIVLAVWLFGHGQKVDGKFGYTFFYRQLDFPSEPGVTNEIWKTSLKVAEWLLSFPIISSL